MKHHLASIIVLGVLLVSPLLAERGAQTDIALVAQFDRDGNGWLNYEERMTAREYLLAHPELREPTSKRRVTGTGLPGPTVSPSDVGSWGDAPLYDPGTVRTLFLEFEHDDWEQELAAFWHTDVDVPAMLTVDGHKYRDVGVHFRGHNSFTAVPHGLKRSMTLTIDFRHKQKLMGHSKVLLLNAHQDPTYLRTALYLQVARDYIPALQSNFMRVVINGESWGVYPAQQAFNSEFTKATRGTKKGARWKSPNNSDGGGFSYLGDDVVDYRRWYEMKGRDKPEAWVALIALCMVLHETPTDKLEQALEPMLDIDGVLKFLAIDIALVNNDGYWKDGSDFNLYLDEDGRFHLTPHDSNEGFRCRGGSGARSPDPLAALDDPDKALRHKLLAVPSLRKRYLAYVGDIAEKWLDWERLGPVVEKHQALIREYVATETRKPDVAAFTTGVYGEGVGAPPSAETIKGFADQRRAFLLNHPEIIKARGGRQP
ncbi:MAG: hypothetical protein GY878_20760 [Fuerstiella sp.]|nr:hypothetical protein [Fuerstiella sp.]